MRDSLADYNGWTYITPGDDRLRRGRFVGVVASRGAGGLVKPRYNHKCGSFSRSRARRLARTKPRRLGPRSLRRDQAESNSRLTREGTPPPTRGHLRWAGPSATPPALASGRARSRAPDTLVEATLHAIADAGSIPAVSTRASGVAARVARLHAVHLVGLRHLDHLPGLVQHEPELDPELGVGVADPDRLELHDVIGRRGERDVRSEEHTSELQSLRHL